MNYLEQINWFWDKVREVEIKPSSRLLYLAILQIWNETRWKAQLKVPRDSAMYLAGIGSAHTYYAALQELADKGFIKYEKGNNQHSAATIEVVVSSSKSASPPASAGASPSATPTAQATASPTASIDKQETSKQETVNNNPPINPPNENPEKDLQKVEEGAKAIIAKHGEEKKEDPPPAPSRADGDVHAIEAEECEILEPFPFEDFWKMYDKKKDRGLCEKAWAKVKERDKEQVMLHHLPAYVKSTPDKTFRKDPIRYLRHSAWENEIIQTEPQSNGRSNNLRGGNGYSIEKSVAALDHVSRRWENGGEATHGYR